MQDTSLIHFTYRNILGKSRRFSNPPQDLFPVCAEDNSCDPYCFLRLACDASCFAVYRMRGFKGRA